MPPHSGRINDTDGAPDDGDEPGSPEADNPPTPTPSEPPQSDTDGYEPV